MLIVRGRNIYFGGNLLAININRHDPMIEVFSHGYGLQSPRQDSWNLTCRASCKRKQPWPPKIQANACQICLSPYCKMQIKGDAKKLISAMSAWMVILSYLISPLSIYVRVLSAHIASSYFVRMAETVSIQSKTKT